MEVVVTVAILAILAAVGLSDYTALIVKSEIGKSEATLTGIQQGFVNFYWDRLINSLPAQFPPTPSDSVMDQEWSDSNVLIDGNNPGSLFSTGSVPENPRGNAYIYYRLEPDSTTGPGFFLRDPDYEMERTFRL